MNAAFRSIAVVLGSLLLGATVGAGVGYVMMVTMPCRWFGSGFEGACGYRALWVSILVGSLIAVVIAAVLIVKYFSTLLDAPNTADGSVAAGPPRALVIWWRVMFGLVVCLAITPLLATFTDPGSPLWSITTLTYGPIGAVLVWALRLIHAGLSFLLARKLGAFPPAVGLVALLGGIGTLAAHGYLTVRLRQSRGSSADFETPAGII